jgi:hypothetical protein
MDELTSAKPITLPSEVSSLITRKKELEELTSPTIKEEQPKQEEIIIETIHLPEDIVPDRPKHAFGSDSQESNAQIFSPAVQESLISPDQRDSETNIQKNEPPIQPINSTSHDIGFGLTVKSNTILQPKIFQRLPQDVILRCRVHRRKNLIEKAYPTFYMYNEADEKFILAARKRKKTANLTYLISTSPDDLSKDSAHYVAKLKY